MDIEGIITDASKEVENNAKDKKRILEIYKQLITDIKELMSEDVTIDHLKRIKTIFSLKRVNTKEVDELIKDKEKKTDSKEPEKKAAETAEKDDKKDDKQSITEKKEEEKDDTKNEKNKLQVGESDKDSQLTKDILTIREIASKILFVDAESETYSVYVPTSTQKVETVTIEFKPLQTYVNQAKMIKESVIFLSDRDNVSDQVGPEQVLFDSSFFSDIKNEDVRYFENYLLEKSMQIKNSMPNINCISSIEKETNPLNIQNTICTSFGQNEYYNLVMDRTNRSYEMRRQAVQFDNVTIDGVQRTITMSMRLHPLDDQILSAVPMNELQTQPLSDVLTRYQLVAADGYATSPKSRVDRDQRLLADVRSQVLSRICELSPYVYRARILSSLNMMTNLWKVNVFSESIENAKDSIYRSAEISFTVADSTTSALSTINVASAQQALFILLNSSIFRLEIDLVGNQSSFGAAISAAMTLIIFPTNAETMSNHVFDDLCNVVYNELIAWAVDRPTFVKRTGATNAFEHHVNQGGGNMNRDIIAFMRYVLLRRPWNVYQRSNNPDYNCDIMLPNIDEANVNDQAYMSINSLLNGISTAAQRNANPGRQMTANSFRKLIKSMKDMCANNMMPLVRLMRYNVERVARIFEWFPYTADIQQLNAAMRDERLRVKLPISGVLSILMGINKAPDHFDWHALLEFADKVRKMNYAEMTAVEDVASYVILKNDGNRSVSKKDTFLSKIKPPTTTITAITKIPSATLTTILSDRMLVNSIRNSRSYTLLTRLMQVVQAAFDNVPTAQHGMAKGALLLPYPKNFGRSSVYVRRDNIIFNPPQGVNTYRISDLLFGRFYQGMIGQIQNMQPVMITGPIKVRTSDPAAIESITSAYLTMSAPYDAYINPTDLKHNKVVEPREVDYFTDNKPTRPHQQFEQMMSKTSVFVLDARRLIVQSNATNYRFNYHDIMITDTVTDKIEFSAVQPPDVTLFNGLLVYEA
uniref:Inner capsid protein VP2 n=1 Tax=Ruddy turnstone rotavirus TaxID=2212774 RepID=A0A3G1RPF9_9REOV|nr:MAG: viral structural protein 2 core protein [Ruddy turnstone rotavirus]